MFNSKDILETIKMIQEENLDIRTITMGISPVSYTHLMSIASRISSMLILIPSFQTSDLFYEI